VRGGDVLRLYRPESVGSCGPFQIELILLENEISHTLVVMQSEEVE
jgi:hypothetical protein